VEDTIMRGRAFFLAAAIALLVVAGAQAMTPFAQRSMRRAGADAARELASVVLPPGAGRVRHDPSVHRKLGAQGVACKKKYVVEDSHFFRIPGSKPASVWSWLRKHSPTHHAGYGELKQDGKPLAWYVMGFLRDQRNVTSRMISISLRAARGGGSAIRVDAIAVGEPRPHDPPCYSAGSY
jgi:hypothetical protein